MLEVGKQAHKFLSKGQGKRRARECTEPRYQYSWLHFWTFLLAYDVEYSIGIFAGQNLTTGKADAWNTHITLVCI